MLKINFPGNKGNQPPKNENSNTEGGGFKISNPKNDDIFTSQVVTLSGYNAPPQKVLWCKVGQRTYQFCSNGSGEFSQVIILEEGINEIEVNCDSDKRTLKVTYQEEVQKKIWIELVWDTNLTDIDLHVLQPDGEMVYYKYKESSIGGRLDVDDRDGFGQEHYTLGEYRSDRPIPGKYIVWINYFDDHNKKQSATKTNCTIRWMIEGQAMQEKKITLTKINQYALTATKMNEKILGKGYAEYVTTIYIK